jgi:hypothetical protein
MMLTGSLASARDPLLRVHSQTLPIISYRPYPFGLKQPTGARPI